MMISIIKLFGVFRPDFKENDLMDVCFYEIWLLSQSFYKSFFPPT